MVVGWGRVAGRTTSLVSNDSVWKVTELFIDVQLTGQAHATCNVWWSRMYSPASADETDLYSTLLACHLDIVGTLHHQESSYLAVVVQELLEQQRMGETSTSIPDS